MNLLSEVVTQHLQTELTGYVNGNMGIYYSAVQAKNRDFLVPDFMFVKEADRKLRNSWVVWEEGGLVPDVVMELISPSTGASDRVSKKDVYEQVVRIPEYFWYDPSNETLCGWRLPPGAECYEPLSPDEESDWLYCNGLGLWLGTWHGVVDNFEGTWPRFFHPDGSLVLTFSEVERQQKVLERRQKHAAIQKAQIECSLKEEECRLKEAAIQRADEEQREKEAALEELEKLRQLLGK